MQPWKTYHFFQQKDVPEIPELQTMEITCVSSDFSQVMFGTNDGHIHVLASIDPPDIIQSDFETNGPILFLQVSSDSSKILIVSKSEDSYVFTICNALLFSPMYELTISTEGTTEIPFISCSGDLTKVAFTLNKKTLTVYTFPNKDTDKVQKLTLKPQTFDLDSEITGIFFSSGLDKNRKPISFIFVPTIQTINCFGINNGKLKYSQIDAIGYTPEPGEKTAFIGENGNLYLCRKNVVSIYSSKGRLLNEDIVLDVKPMKLFRFRQYIVSIVQTDKPTNSLKIYDPKIHCIFGVSHLGIKVSYLLNEWGSLTLILDDGKIALLNEPDIETKVLQLCQKYNQYDVAFKLAQANQDDLSPTVIPIIHHNKGDSFYEKRNYQEAIHEYIEAIGYLEPSYVIKKFLDPQFATYLIEYLEALQEHGNKTANEESHKLHTNLLFGCYIKLKRMKTIQEKIDLAAECQRKGIEPPYDVEAAIEALDNANFDDLALELAKVNNSHETYIKLLAEAHKVQLIVDHLVNMPPNKIEKVVLEHGPLILETLEEEARNGFINFLVSACTRGVNDDPQRMCKAASFSPVFIVYPQYYIEFINRLVEIDADKMSRTIWNDYISCSLKANTSKLTSILLHPKAKYSDEQALIIIREEHLALEKMKNEYIKLQKKNVQNINIDINDVERRLKDITEGLKVIYEHRGLFYELILISDVTEYPKICERFGDRDPYLYQECLLKAVTSKEQNLNIIETLIKTIVEKNIIPIYSILHILEKNVTTSKVYYGFISKYIMNDIIKLQKDIDDKTDTLKKLDKELDEINSDISQMENDYFMIRPDMCRICKVKIDRPSRHFLCGHSFHIGCLGDEPYVCPICKELHLNNAQNSMNSINQAKMQNDIFALLDATDDPQETLNMVLQGSFMDNDLNKIEERVEGLMTKLNMHDE
ncbi:vacuolar protein-sorting-associated protein 11 [Histomonas meleagridis]|uniref:vacuolar protein-sorting-associated protein 11-like n=1 Tax=Histomonas meleagridis TaxID=135588 RepID=UPI003559E0F7|nr:vacuolar protein-sorting-associated protein 11 [Histomonas meleagridis]KAH0804392.1 vacuolar protein-sorting-associated protein 11-like [Histomonas meleagridis]